MKFNFEHMIYLVVLDSHFKHCADKILQCVVQLEGTLQLSVILDFVRFIG